MKRSKAVEVAGISGLAAWTVFGLLTMAVIGYGDTPLSVDNGVLNWSVDHRPDAVVTFAKALTATGSYLVAYPLVVLAGIIAGSSTRQRAIAILLGVACLGAGQALRYGFMTLVARPRPSGEYWMTSASGWAFPSGHTTTATLTAGLLIVAVCRHPRRGRALLALVIGAWGATVGLTRCYLGVHWFTDVFGGWMFALGWLGLWLGALAMWLPARWTPGTTDPS
ncbi:hypothetical protein SALBM311S_03798 [Streptomyces alboniger]|uniref:phosphatase PAP2 family protein n=1 Tax=Streptomyces scabiei TaxID=1930 RepID=UPI002FF062B4